MKMRPLPAVLGLLVVAIALTGLLAIAAPLSPDAPAGASGAPSGSPAAASAEASAVAGLASATPSPTPDASAAVAPSKAPPPTAPPDAVEVAVVPVTDFRTTRTTTNLREVQAILAGTSGRYDTLELVETEADAILAALGEDRPTDSDRLVLVPDATRMAADLAKEPKRLAFLRADAVGPSVRALAWGRDALFGVGRVTDLAEWPLVAALPAGSRSEAFDPAGTWTLFAGGDILLDRGVYKTVVVEGKGHDFPFDGGTVEITGRCRDCSPMGWDLPYTQRTGNAGIVRELISSADLAIANFENPAPNRPTWHTRGTVFSADPALIGGLADAGLDYLSLANNHIRDAGGQGILQTIANIGKHDIAVSGAGRNLAAARKPALLEAAGVTVAVLGYDAIAASYHATADRIGNAPLTTSIVRADVRAARAAGADVVIVFPHWGTEYRATPSASQRRLAHSILDAGADMIIGNHAHWAAAMEVYKGKPIWYALGNFVFDQTWSEPTMEGITLELTFSGGDLVQARMRPHLILDRAQPNFLDPAGDGRVVMNQVWTASGTLLPW